MRLFFVFFVFLILAAPQSGHCADLFVKKPSVTPAEPAPVAPVPEAAPAAPVPPGATAETISDFAGRYYKNCVAKEDKILKGTNQQMLCACSAQKLVEQLTIEDVKTMSTDTPEGQFQRNRLLLQVYAPCMEYPARALLHENCVNGADVQKKVPNFEQVCSCMADGMGLYVAQNAPSIIAKSLRDNPADNNPLSSLMSSPDFQARAQAELTTCLTAPPPAPAPAPAAPAGQQ